MAVTPPFDYSVDALYSSAQARAYENASGLSLADFVRLANEEMSAYLLPYILKARNDYFVTYSDQALVSGTNGYDVPLSASAGEIRAVCLVDSSGNVCARLPEIELEQALASTSLANSGVPTNYYWQGRQVVLFPSVGTGSYSLRIYYFNRPNVLVSASSAICGTSISGVSSTQFTLNFTDTAPSWLANGATVDLIQAVPNFDEVVLAGTVASFTSTTAVVNGVAPAANRSVSGAYYLCQSGYAPVPTGVPGEIVLGPFLQHLVVKLMEARGDDKAYQRAKAELGVLERAGVQYLRRRNTGNLYQLSASPTKFKGGLGAFRRFT